MDEVHFEDVYCFYTKSADYQLCDFCGFAAGARRASLLAGYCGGSSSDWCYSYLYCILCDRRILCGKKVEKE